MDVNGHTPVSSAADLCQPTALPAAISLKNRPCRTGKINLALNHKVKSMEENHKYLEDISEIRKVMDRSSRFLSLSGWSGILAGLYALAGVLVARFLMYRDGVCSIPTNDTMVELFLLGGAVLALAVGTAVVLAYRKAHWSGIQFWSGVTRRLLVNMFVPLAAGGAFILTAYYKGYWDLILPSTLIFYGLALINVSKFTITELWSLGLIQLVLGLAACWIPQHAHWLWGAGFGVLHIVYGTLMWARYERGA